MYTLIMFYKCVYYTSNTGFSLVVQRITKLTVQTKKFLLITESLL